MDKLIILDAGHGGRYPGAISKAPDNYRESVFALGVTWRLFNYLKSMGYHPIPTRGADIHLGESLNKDLLYRATFANKCRADLFLSIHANSSNKNPEGCFGYECWIYKNSSNGNRFANGIIKSFNGCFPDRKNRGIKESTRLVVLRETEMPAVLIEAGFMCSEEYRWLYDNKDEIAKAIAEGVHMSW